MTVLVTGGAGYIGSHVVRQLVANGRRVVVIDNLSRGHRAAVSEQATFHQVDINDTDSVSDILKTESVEHVLHFAAVAYVGESVREPLRYYRNNTMGTLSLLEAMGLAKVHQIVFSSSCATYGVPADIPIRETAPQQPINPYGRSKLFAEHLLRDTAAANPELGFVALRYFNVAGCATDGSLGEDHRPETHLIPLALQAALGHRDRLQIYGNDYPTPDGTCVRDYVHVDDLARAHIRALD
ncbi:MAG: UDP-glucose 4-epimerase GalE, partial [Planctomycetaceae bacterium]